MTQCIIKSVFFTFIFLLINSLISIAYAAELPLTTQTDNFFINSQTKSNVLALQGKQVIKAKLIQGKNIVILDQSLKNRTAELPIGTIILIYSDSLENTITVTPNKGVVEKPKGIYHLPKGATGILQVVGQGSAIISVKRISQLSLDNIFHANSTTGNWSGYARNGGGPYTNITSIWTVPTVACGGGGNTYSSAWPGIDGANGYPSIIQTGTESNCISGSPSYGAWWEIFPAASNSIGNSVHAGDTMYAQIKKNTSNWTITLQNLTQNWSFSTTQTYTASTSSSAEWILEATTVGGTIAPLANYGQISFINNTQNTVNPNHSYVSDSIDMIQSGSVVSSTSTSSGNLNAFSVAYGSVAPTPPVATWSATPNTNGAAYEFAAAKLSSGKVYITGGQGSNPSPNYYDRVEEYNPASNTWTSKHAMIVRRYGHTANVVIASGSAEKFLVVGGRGGPSGYPGDYLKSAELYIPSSNTWTATPDMANYHWYHTATTLDDGKVLIIGGLGNFGARTAAVDLYDPITNTWTAKTSMPAPRVYHTAIKLNDGRVLVVGGQMLVGGVSTATKSAMFYDPTNDNWTQGPDLNTARLGHQAVLLSGGRVMVMGGVGTSGNNLSSVEIWYPATNTWTTFSPLMYARSNHTAIVLTDGRVLVVGGTPSTVASIAEIYDPALDTWSITASTINNHTSHTATLLDNGDVLVVNGSGPSNKAEYFVPNP